MIGTCLYPFLEGFTGAESGDALSGDGDFLARPGVAADASVALFDFKNAEVPYFQPLTFNERLGNRVERLLDDHRDLVLGKAQLRSHLDYQPALGQPELPLRRCSRNRHL